MPAVAINSVKARQEQRVELQRRGWSINMLDVGQPKLDYYRHTPRKTVAGNVVKDRDGTLSGEVGKLIPNQPGDLDTAIRLSERGVLPWKPSVECECKSCRERHGTSRTDKQFMRPQDAAFLADTKFVRATPDNKKAFADSSGLVVEAKEEEPVLKVEKPVLEVETVLIEEVPAEKVPEPLSCPLCRFVTKPGRTNPANSLAIHRGYKHGKKKRK